MDPKVLGHYSRRFLFTLIFSLGTCLIFDLSLEQGIGIFLCIQILWWACKNKMEFIREKRTTEKSE